MLQRRCSCDWLKCCLYWHCLEHPLGCCREVDCAFFTSQDCLFDPVSLGLCRVLSRSLTTSRPLSAIMLCVSFATCSSRCCTTSILLRSCLSCKSLRPVTPSCVAVRLLTERYPKSDSQWCCGKECVPSPPSTCFLSEGCPACSRPAKHGCP